MRENTALMCKYSVQISCVAQNRYYRSRLSLLHNKGSLGFNEHAFSLHNFVYMQSNWNCLELSTAGIKSLTVTCKSVDVLLDRWILWLHSLFISSTEVKDNQKPPWHLLFFNHTFIFNTILYIICLKKLKRIKKDDKT